MEVILKKNIEGVGKFGEIKNVKDGYARNYLIPTGLAVQSSVKAKEEIEKQRESFEKNQKANIENLEKKSVEINNKTIEFEVKTTGGKMFGSITNKDVADKINSDYAVKIEKKNVSLDAIHEPGDYKAQISFGEGIRAEVNIKVISQESEKGE